MKKISEEMQSHLSGDVTTICRCWVIERKDGSILGFTDHDTDMEVDGVSCSAASALGAGDAEQSLGFSSEGREVIGALDSPLLTDEEIDAGLFDEARVRELVVNWADPTQFFTNSTYLLGGITRSDGVFRAELDSLVSLLDQTRARHFIKRCQANLGDDECGVDLSAPEHHANGHVNETKSAIVFVANGLGGHAEGTFKGGRLSWQTGLNTGQSVEIAEHFSQSGNVFVHLWKPMPFDIQTGDQFLIQAGCDKSFSTCSKRFQNTVNFRGFPHMPGNDFAASYVSNSSSMDGGPLVQ